MCIFISIYFIYVHMINVPNVLLDLNIHTAGFSIYIYIPLIHSFFANDFIVVWYKIWGFSQTQDGGWQIYDPFPTGYLYFPLVIKKRVVTWTCFSQGKVLNPIWGSWDRRDGLHDHQRINEFDVLTLGWLREMWKPKVLLRQVVLCKSLVSSSCRFAPWQAMKGSWTDVWNFCPLMYCMKTSDLEPHIFSIPI